jgi:hypothetical protein
LRDTCLLTVDKRAMHFDALGGSRMPEYSLGTRLFKIRDIVYLFGISRKKPAVTCNTGFDGANG